MQVTPGFLRRLSGECVIKTIDGFEAPPRVLQVHDAEQVDLLKQEIFASDRKLPIVIVTDPVYEGPLVRDLPRKAAEYLFALCRVVHVSPRMTYSLTDRLGKELSVFDGGVRIYWPGASRTDIGSRHPLLLRRTQAAWGQSPDAVERELLARLSQALIRAAAPRFRVPPAIDAFQQRVARESLEASSATVQELKRMLAERGVQLDDAREMERLALSDNQRLEALVHGLEEELQAAREALFTERNKSTALQGALRARGAAPETLAGVAEPSTAEEAIERGRV